MTCFKMPRLLCSAGPGALWGPGPLCQATVFDRHLQQAECCRFVLGTCWVSVRRLRLSPPHVSLVLPLRLMFCMTSCEILLAGFSGPVRAIPSMGTHWWCSRRNARRNSPAWLNLLFAALIFPRSATFVRA